MLLVWIALAVCVVAVATDVRMRRIPNELTLGFAAFALIVHALQGWRSFSLSLLMLVVVLFFGALVFSLGWLGGGDVKLAAAVAAALSFPDTIAFLLYMSIGGGVFAIVYAIAKGRLGATARNLGSMLAPLAYQGTVGVAGSTPLAFPYAAAIAAGAVAVALSHTVAPFLRLPL